MTTNTVDIEVRLDGAQEAKKGLTGIGETAASMADRFDKSNSHLGEGLGSLVGNVEDASGAFKDLSSTVKSLGTGGKASFLSLIPAIGGVVAVGFALFETFINISGAAQEAEDANEAFGAAAADLQSKLEALAEKGVRPTRKELESFTRANLTAQLAKEEIEKQTVKTSRALGVEAEAQKELTDAIINRNSFTRKFLITLGFYNDVSEARLKLDKAVEKSQRAINKGLNLQEEAQKRLAAAESEYLDLEKQAPEVIAAKTKENIERLKTLQLLEAEQETSREIREGYKLDLEAQQELMKARLRDAAKDKAALVEFAKEIEQQLSVFDEGQLRQEDIDRRRVELSRAIKAENAKLNAELIAQRKSRKSVEDAIERQTQNEIFTIRAMSLQHARMMGADQLDILDAQHQLELERAGDNNNRRLMADIKYQMSKTQLEKAEGEKRAAEEQRQADQRRAFIAESRAFDIDMMQDGIDKELAALKFKYDQERSLKQHSEEELTELTRRFTLERAEIQNRALNEQMQGFKNLALSAAESFGRDATRALFDTLTDQTADEARKQLAKQFNEQIEEEKKALKEFKGTQAERVQATAEANDSMIELRKQFVEKKREIDQQEKTALPRAIGDLLIALGKQAAVESLIFGAKAVASLFIDPKLAANYGIASGIMLTAAGLAGFSGMQLKAANPVSSSSSISSASSVSPLGTPQIAPTREREQAETATTVFNINFGGAVVYDTKRAAEIALADRITTIQNQTRRGAPRRRF